VAMTKFKVHLFKLAFSPEETKKHESSSNKKFFLEVLQILSYAVDIGTEINC
jgi:hypothetical protein